MTTEEIIAALPYAKPFMFVDGISEVSENQISGHYRFREDESFYAGHFPGRPVTPGVILIECMAQIALVCHGLHLLSDRGKPVPEMIAFSSANVDFLLPVFPGQEVKVLGELVYFRMGKIKSKATLFVDGNKACVGELTGMLRS